MPIIIYQILAQILQKKYTKFPPLTFPNGIDNMIKGNTSSIARIKVMNA
jgi:hypothetical protein